MFSASALAQEKVNIHQTLIWYGGSITRQFENGNAVGLKIERRDFTFPGRKQQLVLPNIYASKKLSNHWKLDVGIWIFTIYQPGNQAFPVRNKQYEWRPYFTLDYKQPVKRGFLNVAVKSEYRGFNAAGVESHFEGAFETYVVRERFLVRYTYPITSNLAARAGEELLLNVAGNRGLGTFDQNRLMTDMVYSLEFKGSKDQLKLHAGYLHWYQPTGIINTYFSHHIITTGVDFVF